MKPVDQKRRKNILCLSKETPTPLREFLTIRGDARTVPEAWDIFARQEEACKLMRKKKCSIMIAYNKNSDSRTVTVLRTVDYLPLEMLRFRITKSQSSTDFPGIPAELFARYFVVTRGIQNKRMENLVIDLFNQRSSKVDIESVKYAWVITQRGPGALVISFMRVLNDLTVEEIGPCIEMEVEKEFYSGEELYAKAGSMEKVKKQKNVTKTVCKDSVGRVFVEKQDLKEVAVKKSRAYKNVR